MSVSARCAKRRKSSKAQALKFVAPDLVPGPNLKVVELLGVEQVRCDTQWIV